VDDQINYYVGASLSTGVEGLTVGGSYDYVDNLNGVANQYGYAWALYASYQLNEQLKLSYRAELAGSSGGIHLPGALNDEQVFGNTLTLDYALWKNVISRLEYRLDSVVGGTPTLPGTTSRVFDGDKNDHSLTVNIVYLF
jgi:opacity protein-like surface antigen